MPEAEVLWQELYRCGFITINNISWLVLREFFDHTMHAINAANKQTQRSNKQCNQKLSENMTIRMVYTLNKPLADEYTTQAHCTANLYHKQIKQSNATTHVRSNPHPLDVLTPCLHSWTKETIIWPNVLFVMETSWPLWKRKNATWWKWKHFQCLGCLDSF